MQFYKELKTRQLEAFFARVEFHVLDEQTIESESGEGGKGLLGVDG